MFECYFGIQYFVINLQYQKVNLLYFTRGKYVLVNLHCAATCINEPTKMTQIVFQFFYVKVSGDLALACRLLI